MKLLSSFIALLLAVSAARAQQTQAQVPTDSKDLATLEGRVTSPSGQPLRKSTLTLRPAITKPGEQVQAYTTVSDAEGKFVFGGVEPGRYSLFAEHAGYLRTAYGAKKSSIYAGTQLTLTGGLHMKDIVVQMVPQAVISGRVLDDDGDPVANANVRPVRQVYSNGKRQMLPAGNAQTDESGEFKLRNLTPGRYYLSADPPRSSMFGESSRKAGADSDPNKPEEDLVTTYYPGVKDLASATQMEVIPGRDMPGTDIRLRKSQVFRIKGKLAGGTIDQPLQRLRVTVQPRDSGLMGFSPFAGNSAVGKDGSFEIAGVQPGSYNLIAMNVQGMFAILAHQPLDVANRSINDVVLNVQPPGQVRGTVKIEGQQTGDAEKNPIDLTTVQLVLSAVDGVGMNNPAATVKKDGTFAVENVSAGKYLVRVFNTPDGTYVKSARIGDQDASRGGAEVGPASEPLQVVLSTAAGQIDGTVQADPPEAAQGSSVLLVPDPLQPEQTQLYKSARADQNSQFTIKDIAPGKYRIYAFEDMDSGELFDPEYLKPVENRGVKITVDENSHQQTSVSRLSTADYEAAKHP